MTKQGLLERLKDGVVIGDGGYVFALEKRGYVTAGPWTTEAASEHPEAVRQLHREFVRAGSDVLQTFTFYSSDDKLKFRDNKSVKEVLCSDINNCACIIAKEVASEGNVLVAGGISENIAYTQGKGKQYIQNEIKKQMNAFVEHQVDFVICEFFDHIEEMEWNIEEVRKYGLPIVATMCIGLEGDLDGISIGECAVRMARAKADVVGVNCLFDPNTTLEAIKLMKKALDQEGLCPYLATQPNGFYTSGTGPHGYLECPEFPYAMEPRTITRFDANKYAREAYDLGVRYIGGCCGFEAYHIRAIAEELADKRNKPLPKGSEKSMPWGTALTMSSYPIIRERASRAYWEHLVPGSGRIPAPTYPLPQKIPVTKLPGSN